MAAANIYSPGQLYGRSEAGSKSGILAVPGTVYPNQQITINVTINSLVAGAFPGYFRFLFAQVDRNGADLQLLWDSGQINTLGPITPAVISGPFNPALFRFDADGPGIFTPVITAT
jgi:hypothetical protein